MILPLLGLSLAKQSMLQKNGFRTNRKNLSLDGLPTDRSERGVDMPHSMSSPT
jgi:hypothetical protein